MKELLKLYAEYNLETIGKIGEIIAALDEETLNRDRNTWYGSILKLVHHIISGSWHYLHAIRGLTDGKYCAGLPDLADLKESFRRSVPDTLRWMIFLAEKLAEVAGSITDHDLHVEKRNNRIYNGRTVDMSVWRFFLQTMTHQTHHQGQLSQLFDELKIEHEFGNIFPLIPDSQPDGE